MGSRSLVDRLYARHAAGLPFLPIAGGEPAPGETPPPAAPAPAQQPQTPPPPAAPQPQVVSVPYTDFQTLMALPARLAQFESQQAEAKRKADEQVANALLQKGQAEEAVRTVRDQWQAEANTLRTERATLESRAKNYAIDTAVAQALAGVPLVPGAAQDIQALIRGEFEAVPEGDGFAVRTRTFQTPADRVKEFVASKPHYQPPTTQGGGGAASANVPAATQTGQAGDPQQARVNRLRAVIGSERAGAPGLAGTYGSNLN